MVKNGTAKNAIEIKSNVEVAGKTGTTTDMCDRYFVGYTPDVIGGCWMGYEYPKKIESKGNPTLKIWNDILNEIYSLPSNKYTDNTFKTPLGVRELSYDKGSGLLPNIYSSSEDIKYGWFAD